MAIRMLGNRWPCLARPNILLSLCSNCVRPNILINLCWSLVMVTVYRFQLIYEVIEIKLLRISDDNLSLYFLCFWDYDS